MENKYSSSTLNKVDYGILLVSIGRGYSRSFSPGSDFPIWKECLKDGCLHGSVHPLGIGITQMSTWYVLRSKPNKEEFLAGQLRAHGFNVYLPQLHVKPVNPRARKVRPFFPGYLFVQADVDFRYSDVQWLPGSQGLVNFGGELASLSEAIVVGIRNRVDAANQTEVESRSGFLPNEKVLIVEGVFSGYEALFDTRLSGANRVRVLLSFMKGRQTPVELSETSLRKKK